MIDTTFVPEHDTLLHILSDMVFAATPSSALSEALAWYFLRRLVAQVPAVADAFSLEALAQPPAVADHALVRVPPALSAALADGIYVLTRQPTPETETAVCWRVLAQLVVAYPAIGVTLTPAGQATLLAHTLVQPPQGVVDEVDEGED